MQALCPHRHSSSTTDFCSKCGANMTQPSGNIAGSQLLKEDASPSNPSTLMCCPDCNVERDSPVARFCENCRYDYVEGKAYQGGPVIINSPVVENLRGQYLTTAPSSGLILDALLGWDAVVSVNPEGKDYAGEGPAVLTERVYPLDVDDNLIGRLSVKDGIYPEIEIKEDLGVSRRHARIIRKADGKLYLLDQSSNGTSLNGKVVEPHVETPLNQDCEITLGFWTVIKLRSR